MCSYCKSHEYIHNVKENIIIKKWKLKTKILEINFIISEMKNRLDRINSRLYIKEEDRGIQ